jgi:sterol desaturase/sphingolipid hydroxylase (fatty acid hydroxylase superfamily)
MNQWIERYLQVLERVGSRYFIIAGFAFLLFYVILRSRVAPKKIQRAFPLTSDYRREILYSVGTILIFGCIPMLLIFNASVRPYTTLYNTIAERGWWYYIGIFPIMFLMHDTYFYWTHRLMHHPRLFRYFHLVHHQSTNPSPWAAYSFHPLEAIVEVGIFAVFLFTLPVHATHIILFFLLSIIYNVYGHLGWELYPKGFNKTFIGRWINTSVSHNQHHKYFKGNYGLYFLFWDRWMNTLRAEYDDAFEKATTATSQ